MRRDFWDSVLDGRAWIVASLRANCMLLVVLSLALPLFGFDSAAKAYAETLKGQYFQLRISEAQFVDTEWKLASGFSWKERRIDKLRAALVGTEVSIGGTTEWQELGFASGRRYKVRDVKSDANGNVLVKMWADKIDKLLSEDEIQITFENAPTPEQFQKLFFTVFLKPNEDFAAYEKSVAPKLVAKYVDPHPELLALPFEKRELLLTAIRALSSAEKPELERHGNHLFIAVELFDPSVYNDIQVSKNQRIASSIDFQLGRMRANLLILRHRATEVPVVHGVRMHWNVHHRDFLSDRRNATEQIEVLAPLNGLREFEAGNLSALELLQTCILRVGGTKVTLTSYDPIGHL